MKYRLQIPHQLLSNRLKLQGQVQVFLNSALNTPETGSSGSTRDGATADAVAIKASTPTETTASSTATDSIEAVIIHTNDVHGRILEEKGVIGDAKAAAVIEEERSKVEKTIVVDAGDAFQGSANFQLYKR